MKSRICNITQSVLVITFFALRMQIIVLNISKCTNLKKQYHLWTLIIVLKEISETLIEDDLFLPFWNCNFVFLEVKGLSYDGQDVLDVFLLVEGWNMTMAENQMKLWE